MVRKNSTLIDGKPTKKPVKKRKNTEKDIKLTKEEAQQAAMAYIMALIKRDSKPTNPETLIMIKLFEKMSDTRAKRYRYFDLIRTVLRRRNE